MFELNVKQRRNTFLFSVTTDLIKIVKNQFLNVPFKHGESKRRFLLSIASDKDNVSNHG